LGELGLDGIADAVTDMQRLGVLMPVVPCLLNSSLRLEGASILRVSSLGEVQGHFYLIAAIFQGTLQ